MVLVNESYAAADATVDTNLSAGKIWQKSARPRRIVRIGLVGSSAVNNTRIGVYYGSEKVATMVNVAGAAANDSTPDKTSSYWMSSKLICGSDVPINVIVEDAPTTNNITLMMDIVDY